MIEFKLLIRRFREFGGWRLVKEYAKLGVIPVIVKAFCRCILGRKSLRTVYPAIYAKVCPMLVSKYKHIVLEGKAKYELKTLPHEHPKVVWWCWLQGEDNAPAIVKACLESLRKNLPLGYEIRVIDETNWNQWVMLPEYVVEKRQKGYIPLALFSDLLRLELLIKYGGTWIDSTVYCTGFQKTPENVKWLEADLFLFQYTRPGSTQFKSISNWFISAHSNNKVLMTMRDMLMAYWQDYDCTLDYYIFHLFFEGVVKVFPEEISAMPYAYSVYALQLLKHWHEEYDEARFASLTSMSSFHKLNSRPRYPNRKTKISIYQHLIGEHD